MKLPFKLDLINKIKLGTPFLIFTVFYMTWFTYLEGSTARLHHVIYTSIDNYIPFCEYFIVPYFLWFLFIPVTVILIMYLDEDSYKKLSYVLMTGMFIFLLFNTFYPTVINLRPAIIPSDNIFSAMVADLYSQDTPTNVLPSIHVYNTLAVTFALNRCKKGILRNKVVINSCNIMAVLIIMATMLLKQHSIIDVIAAFLLYAAVKWCFDGIYYIIRKPISNFMQL